MSSKELFCPGGGPAEHALFAVLKYSVQGGMMDGARE